MLSFQEKLKKNHLFILYLFFFIITDIAIILNIPLFRQIFGFCFLSLLPGLLIQRILKLNKICIAEKFILSIGLSISFLMPFGLLINDIFLFFGINSPLATNKIMFSLNIIFFVFLILGSRMDVTKEFYIPKLNLALSEKIFLIGAFLFPAMAILGTHLMNTNENNIILMILLLLISIYFILIYILKERISEKVHLLFIFSVSLSLLLMYSLRFNHIIIGSDTGREFYSFIMTSSNLYWSLLGNTSLDACLSISILPAIYQSILSINNELLFKVFYSLIFSISPLAIYIIINKYAESKYAVLGSLFFMSQLTFLCTPSVARTNIAILFCLLVIMTLFSEDISAVNKRILIIIFMVNMILSHYASTYIFLFIIIATWFITKSIYFFIKADIPSKHNANRHTVSSKMTLSLIMLFFILIFLWYGQLTDAAFNSGLGFIQTTILNLDRFFTLESRSSSLPELAGQSLSYGFASKINLISTWMTFIFIGIGILSMIYDIKLNSKSQFSDREFEINYLSLAIACFLLMVSMVILPYVSRGYNIHRLNLQMMTILSLCFIFGGMFVSSIFSFVFSYIIRILNIQKIKYKNIIISPYLVILLILLPYFLSNTGFSYELFGVPKSITLSSGNSSPSLISDQDDFSSKWLAQYRISELTIFSNNYGPEILASQGRIPPLSIKNNLPDIYKGNQESIGYIYLGHYEINMLQSLGSLGNLNKFALYSQNRIYSNGASEIFN